MIKVKLTEEELKSKLKEQIQLLKNSTKLYDDGCIIEAYNMSNRIRLLLHDTKNSSSLLNQLKKKNILFYDTSIDDKADNPLPLKGLIYMKIKLYSGNIKEVTNVPRSEVSPPNPIKKIPFEEWWDKIILDDKNGNKLTRRGLVLYVAETDGGAHVDPSLDEPYVRITKGHSLGKYSVVSKGETSIDNNVELPSIRQIAYEILLSFENACLIE